MKGLFTPAMVTMGRLSYRKKMILVAAMFLVPIGLLGYFLVTETNSIIDFAARERLGVAYNKPLFNVLAEVAGRRGAQRGNGSSVKDVDTVDSRLGKELHVAETWNAVKPHIDRAPSEAVVALLALIVQVADNSNLTLDPDITSYYAMDTTTTKIPGLIDGISQAEGLALKILANGKMTADDKTALTIIVGQIKSLQEGMVKNLETAYKETPGLMERTGKPSEEASAGAQAFVALLTDTFLKNDSLPVSTAEVSKRSETAMKAAVACYNVVADELDSWLVKRITRLAGKRNLMLAISAAVLLLGGYLFVGFYLSVVRSVALLKVAARKMADGDLTVQVTTGGNDEIEEIARDFNAMTVSLGGILENVAATADRVAHAAHQAVATSEHLADGAAAAANRVDNVASAAEEMSATSAEIARNCVQAADNSDKTGIAAADNTRLLQEIVTIMATISSSVKDSAVTIERLGAQSDQIGAIAGTIDEIADQTNLLALNAAIEAARAGDQGRGFAVVADQVRSLAERTSKATQEITAMIKGIQTETANAVHVMQSGVAEVDRGASSTSQSGAVVQVMIARIDEVTSEINQIATAATQQTATAESISGDIVQVAQIVQGAAQDAQETAGEAAALLSHAEELKTMMGRFKISA